MPYISVATEDELAESVACRLVSVLLPDFEINLRLRKGGNGYLRSSLHKFRNLAQRERLLLLTDLDTQECAPALLNSWNGGNALPPNLLFRVCVREVEAWLLADRQGFATLLGISQANIPGDPETLQDPKAFLLNVARRASRSIRLELLATRGAVAAQGLGYNRLLCAFVEDGWSIERARENSDSLNRAIQRIQGNT